MQLRRAMRLHQQGDLATASKLYRQILQHDPHNADANHLMGVLMQQMGKYKEAIKYISRAITIQSQQPLFHNNLGIVLGLEGRNQEALQAFDRAVHFSPEYDEAHYNRGVALQKLGRVKEALAAFTKCVELKPDYFPAYNNRGIVLKEMGDLKGALADFQKAVAIQPNFAEAHNNLGVVLQQLGRAHDAITAYRSALQSNPLYADAHTNLGALLLERGDLTLAKKHFEEALRIQPNSPQAFYNRGVVHLRQERWQNACHDFQEALRRNPNYPEAFNNQGFALYRRGELEGALDAFAHAIRLRPEYAEAYNNRGTVFQAQNRLSEALRDFDRAIQLQPSYAEAHWNRSLVLLLRGDFEQGWREFEWRWRKKDFATPKRDFPQPLWDGRALGKKVLLIHTEQGAGDSIQFVRYLPEIATRGGRIHLECDPALTDLFTTLPGICQVIAKGDPLPHFDYQAPLMSLPCILKTDISTIPCQIPYLFPAPGKIRLHLDPALVNIGIVWAGNPRHKNDRNRSVPLQYFLDLLPLEGIKFYSLQVTDSQTDLSQCPLPAQIEDLSPRIRSYSDTASFIQQLDLVISVDTSVAHLAGALGKPVWTLLPFAPDWRWMLEREDTPWYPSMRLFRQSTIGDWQGVFQKLKEELLHISQKWNRQTS